MNQEIERKFLVHQNQLPPLSGGEPILQGYVAVDGHKSVRVRIRNKQAYLTVKGERRGASRPEYEYPLPVQDAEQMIQELCSERIVEKTRYKINFQGHVWEVDVFHRENDGLVLAEVELDHEGVNFELPEWAGEDVTDDDRFYNMNLARNPYTGWPK